MSLLRDVLVDGTTVIDTMPSIGKGFGLADTPPRSRWSDDQLGDRV